MADFTEIIQEINTNLPDNTTQSITAAKLRTTLIDLTNTIDNQQDSFEEDIQNEFDTLEGQINDAVLDFQSVIVDNLNSTDATKALSANQGTILKETIYGTNDNTLGSALAMSSSPGGYGFQNGSSSSSNCYLTSGNIRSNYWDESNFVSLEIGKYRYLRITANSSKKAYITFLKKDKPTAQKTYQELVDEGYLSKVHNSYSNVLISVDAETTKDIEIPNDAKAFMIVTRTAGDGSSASVTVRQPESVIPYGLIQSDNIYYNVTIPDGYVKSNMIGDGEVKTNDIADGAITVSKLEDDLVQKEMTGSTNEYFSFNLIDFNNLSQGYINSSGNVNNVSNYYSTQFIKLAGKKIYWGTGFSRYGTGTNGAAVYNANKGLIRVFIPSSSGSYDPVEMNEGAEYIRLTYTGNYTLRYVVYAKSDGSNPMNDQSAVTTSMIDDYYRDQVINNAGINIRFPKENVPETIPAISMCGQKGISKTYDNITGGNYVYVENTEYPSYLKCNHTISFKGYIANALSGSDTIKFGLHRNNSSGKIVCITPTQVIIQRYDSGYVNNKAYSHGLTIQDFIMCEVSFTWYGGKLRIVSSGGSFVQEWQNSDYSYPGNAQVNYGRVFLEPSMDMTNVKISQTSDRFMKPVWVIGDSYTSMASARWTYQMVNNFGVDGFLLDGYAGAPSENMVPELKQLLKYGTPKYLYWCLGMNDGAVIWKYCATEVECMCRERGITLIYQTIPYPTSGTSAKSIINTYIKESGYRYVDAYSAVCKDDNGTWYDGMLDDGTHPTVLGAKAIAGQVLVDFPEIANYK